MSKHFEFKNFDAALAVMLEQVAVAITPYGREHGAEPPSRAHTGDVGYDLCTLVPITIPAHGDVKVPLGLNFQMPVFEPRSPVQLHMRITARTGLGGGKGLLPGAVVVDSGYRSTDEYGLTLWLRNVSGAAIELPARKAVAQAVFVVCLTPARELRVMNESEMFATERSGGRFGSTGR